MLSFIHPCSVMTLFPYSSPPSFLPAFLTLPPVFKGSAFCLVHIANGYLCNGCMQSVFVKVWWTKLDLEVCKVNDFKITKVTESATVLFVFDWPPRSRQLACANNGPVCVCTLCVLGQAQCVQFFFKGSVLLVLHDLQRSSSPWSNLPSSSSPPLLFLFSSHLIWTAASWVVEKPKWG